MCRTWATCVSVDFSVAPTFPRFHSEITKKHPLDHREKVETLIVPFWVMSDISDSADIQRISYITTVPGSIPK